MSVANAPWHKTVVDEIWKARMRGKAIEEDDLEWLRNIDHRVSLGLGLSASQEDRLQKLHFRLTEPYQVRIYA